jgi:hypothetical protein
MLVVDMEVQQPSMVFYNVYDTYTIDYYFIPGGQLWATQNTDSAVSMKTQIQIMGAQYARAADTTIEPCSDVQKHFFSYCFFSTHCVLAKNEPNDYEVPATGMCSA